MRALAAILRVPEGLDRTHTQRITAVGGEVGRKRFRLVLEAASDPQVELWDAERKAGLFARVFGAAPTLVWTGAPKVAWRPGRARRVARLRLAAS